MRAPDLPADETTDPVEILRLATEALSDVVVVSSLGPQTLVIIELLHRLGRVLPVLLLDTGLLFPETWELKRRVEQRYGITVATICSDLTLPDQARAHGPALWERDPDTCCRLRKVEPLKQALAGRQAWISGLRRDQSEVRAGTSAVSWDERHGLLKINPLWAWSQGDVLDFLRANGVPYNPLLDDGYRSVGCQPCTRRSTAGERDGRWPGRSKTECGIHLPAPAPTTPSFIRACAPAEENP